MSHFCDLRPVQGKLSITEHRQVLKKASQFYRFAKPGSFWALYRVYRSMALIMARLQLKSWRPTINYRQKTIDLVQA